jgi:outer membrane protein assembly factor BamB
MTNRTVLSVMLALLCVSMVSAADPAKQPFIGFRNDGTGVFPADCKPVTRWNEMDFKEVDGYSRKGRKTKVLEPTEPNEVNIAWKKDLPMHCNGGMTVVGGKVFLLADPGGKGFAGKDCPDFMGVRIYCLDATTGKVLWTDDMHHADVFPGELGKKVAQALREQREFQCKALGAHLKWYAACRQRSKGEPVSQEVMEEDYRKAAAEYRKYVPQVPATLAEQRADKEWQAKGYVQIMFSKIVKKYVPEAIERQKFLREYGYKYNDFFGQGSFIEQAMQTPVSDGKHIYVNTSYGDAFCYDLDGNLVWKKWYGYSQDRLSTITSPMLVGDLMITAGQFTKEDKGQTKGAAWIAINKKNGEIVWKTPRRGGKSYTCATPTVHHLPVGGDESNKMAVLWCPTGQVLRVSDGKVLATELGSQGNSRPWAVQDDILVICNGSSDGGGGRPQTWKKGTVAFRLKAPDRDKVTAEMLWIKTGREDLSRLVARDGVLYGFRGRNGVEAVDIKTGKILHKTGISRLQPHHLSAIAGDYLFGLDHDGQCIVVDISDGLKQVSLNRLGEREYRSYDFFNEGAQPFFSGNRIFIRSYTTVYCIGDPDQPTKLSAAHK